MTIDVRLMKSSESKLWDEYVHLQPKAGLYNLAAWSSIINEAYRHRSYYFVAFERQLHGESKDSATIIDSLNLPSNDNDITGTKSVRGILPLVHLRHFLFGNRLISIPFFDFGGIITDDNMAIKALLAATVKFGKALNASYIEIRQTQKIAFLEEAASSLVLFSSAGKDLNYRVTSYKEKFRLLLQLPESADRLMQSFKSKLRSQIKKPIKEGLIAKIGFNELIDDFYNVFSKNMRDLGSPVHSKKLIDNTLSKIPKQSRIIVVYKDGKPLASSLIVGFRDTLENPWASSLKEYSKLSPNMLLYWTMLKYACEEGYTYFDFGRSSKSEGTFKFKQQWGAKPQPMHWYRIQLQNSTSKKNPYDKKKYGRFIQIWKNIPVPITRKIGPLIRKHIEL